MSAQALDNPAIAAVRHFNRFYTGQIGLLAEGMVGTTFSLTEGRVLFELGQRDGMTAAEIAARLGIDPGYLSRLLRGFVAAGLVSRKPSTADRRQTILNLTARGRKTFGVLDQGSQQEIGTLLGRLDEDEQRRLLGAMATIETLLQHDRTQPAHSVVLRPHRPEDLCWMVARHGAIYAREQGWGAQFKLLVAGIVADFMRHHDPAREGCWIAEQEGEPAGSVMLVDDGDGVAKLRLLLVEPRARGLGIGQSLVEECIRFARAAGYRRITLWTHTVLSAARSIYAKSGFVLVEQKPHRHFGIELMGETWDLTL